MVLVEDLLEKLPKDFSNAWFYAGLVLILSAIGGTICYVNGSVPTLSPSEELLILMFSIFVWGGVQVASLYYKSLPNGQSFGWYVTCAHEELFLILHDLWRKVVDALQRMLTCMVAVLGSVILYFWDQVGNPLNNPAYMGLFRFVMKSVKEVEQRRFDRTLMDWAQDLQQLFEDLTGDS